jgi:RimJ/RimL family protein N-acetyltransferase
MKIVCETARLVIRQFNLNDAEFIVNLLNQESFIRYIADKNVRSIADAIKYLNNGPISSYQVHGFGLNLVQLKGTDEPIGMCGLLKRAELDHADLGLAFLPGFWGKGYAWEAADAVLKKGMAAHALSTILAVTLPDNVSSNSLLQKVGFRLTGTVALYGLQNNLYEYRN